MKITITILFAVFALISTILVSSVSADSTVEFYISTDGNDTDGDGSSGSPFATIRGAVSAYYLALNASEEPIYEFTIYVNEGNYNGSDNLNVPLPPVNLTIQSADKDETKVIFDCLQTIPYAFNDAVGSFQLEYVTIQNCQRAVDMEYASSQDNQDVYINQVIFANVSQFAIWVEYTSSMSVENCNFSSTYGNGYVAYISVIGDYSSGIDILSNQFYDGSGVVIINMNGGNIVSNGFTNMTGATDSSFSAIYIEGGLWDIKDNGFYNVISGDGYSAVTLYYEPTVNTTSNYTLESNEFDNCQSPNYFGGALNFVGVFAEVTDCTFTSNTAITGGAIYAVNSNVTVQKSTFTSNNATRSGGAIDIERDSFLFLYDNTFDSNYANNTLNSLSCCSGLEDPASCTATLIINDNSQGDFTDDNTCKSVTYVSTDQYFETLGSYAYQPFSSSSGSLWWVWLLVSFALIATIVVVGVAVGFFIYTKKKRSYEAYA